MPWERLCRLIQALWWWVFLFKRQARQHSLQVQNHNMWLRGGQYTQAVVCFFTVIASHPSGLTIQILSFHSDLLSSDYVEIHYEAGKPVLSKVTSPPVTKYCTTYCSCFGGVWLCGWHDDSGSFSFKKKNHFHWLCKKRHKHALSVLQDIGY